MSERQLRSRTASRAIDKTNSPSSYHIYLTPRALSRKYIKRWPSRFSHMRYLALMCASSSVDKQDPVKQRVLSGIGRIVASSWDAVAEVQLEERTLNGGILQNLPGKGL
uniref:Ovule protein n=1 Tax=Parascaris univalens TaxID=6257 RepID=A0A915A652_PARUN